MPPITKYIPQDKPDELYKELERIQKKLDEDDKQGKSTYYDVKVDGITAIERTNDPEKFQLVEEYISILSTQVIEVRFYRGASFRNESVQIFLQGNMPQSQPRVNLDDLQLRMDEKLTQAKRDWACEQLQRDFDKLKTEHDELGEYTDKIEEELKVFREKKLHMGKVNLGELGGILLEGFIRRNPQILSKLPGGEALAGVITEDNEQKLLETPVENTEGEASVSRSSSDPSEDDGYLELLRQIQNSFSQSDFLQVMGILDKFIKDPSLIPVVQELIDSPQSQKPKNTNTHQNPIPDDY